MKDLFKRIASEYIGTITETKNDATIENDNKICSDYGVVHCTISIKCWDWGLSLWCDEKTNSIIGGRCIPFNELNLRKELERYGFRKKDMQQLSLFDIL